MTKQTLVALLLFLGFILAACQGAPTPSPGPTEGSATPTRPAVDDSSSVLLSSHPRITAPSVSDDAVGEAVAGNSAFAFDLYQALPADANLMFSPYSISQALAMTYAGARGNTEQEMAAALHFTLPQARLHPALNALDLALLSPPETQEDTETPFQLNIANSIWGQKGYSFLPDFLDVLAENYGAGLRVTDFVSAPDLARQAINKWVSHETQDKIKDLIPPDAITQDTRLVLANAIYFKAGWLFPFEPNLTRDAGFKLLDGSQASVPMMTLAAPESLSYGSGDKYQAVVLPYLGAKASMILIVPEAGRFAEFQDSLTAETVHQIVTGLAPKQVMLAMPKFSFESEFALAEALAGMGMADAFMPGAADFSGMDGTRELFISAVQHKAFIAVDEAGTEAAAATAVIVGVTSMPLVDVELTVDRPFIFLIRDDKTGALLFLGQVLDPRS